MKKLLKKILQKKIRKLAQDILEKYKPDIIGITGSVGKTSAKEAVFFVLEDHVNARTGEKNYNNEIGVPLTIIGSKTGGSSPMKWREVFMSSKKLLKENDENYPRVLVLEMGADKQGDIEYLSDLARPKIGIVTAVGLSHSERLGNIANIAREKRKLIEGIPRDGFAILNGDDENVWAMRTKTKGRVISFGSSDHCDLRAAEARNGSGISFKLLYEKSVIPVSMPNIFGKHFIYSALCAIAVGRIYDIPLIKIVESLREFRPPRGRMNRIDGIKGSIIFDDTYNSSGQSSRAAIDVLKDFEAPRKIAVLGDMLELGKFSASEHMEVGGYAVHAGVDILITVGERARDIARGAHESGMSEDYIFSFANTSEAGKFLQDRIQKDDVILIKGSQGMRMEKIIKELMAKPEFAPELLVRQSEEWLKNLK